MRWFRERVNALEDRLEARTQEVNRLLELNRDLCTQLAKRVDLAEVDKLRGELAKYKGVVDELTKVLDPVRPQTQTPESYFRNALRQQAAAQAAQQDYMNRQLGGIALFGPNFGRGMEGGGF